MQKKKGKKRKETHQDHFGKSSSLPGKGEITINSDSKIVLRKKKCIFIKFFGNTLDPLKPSSKPRLGDIVHFYRSCFCKSHGH